MSEAPDPLEAELSALRPRPISPGLRQRVGDRLNAPAARRQWAWGIALAGALTAAVVVLVAPRRKDPLPPELPVVVPAPPVATESDDSAPTVVAYQRALARSPEDLDALFDKQATTALNPNLMAVGTYTPSPATIDALIGDD
jgi:hypothetical protein